MEVGACVIWWEAERPGAASPGEENPRGGLTHVHEYLVEG